MLNDFIATLPLSAIAKSIVEDDVIRIPTTIDSTEFYKKFRDEIESGDLTKEKAIYLASINKPKQRLSIPELLIKGR